MKKEWLTLMFHAHTNIEVTELELPRELLHFLDHEMEPK